VAARRVLPLAVLGTLPGAASTTSSGGTLSAVPATAVILPRSPGQVGRVAQAGLGYQNNPLGSGARIGAAEYGDPAMLHAGELACGLLGLVGVQVAAAADDDVLHPPSQVQLTARQVAEVPGVHPRPVAQRPGGRLVAELARGGGRSGELDPVGLEYTTETVTCFFSWQGGAVKR